MDKDTQQKAIKTLYILNMITKTLLDALIAQVTKLPK